MGRRVPKIWQWSVCNFGRYREKREGENSPPPVSRGLKTGGLHFRQKLRNFWNLTLFDIEDIDLGSPKLHAIEIFSQTTFHKSLVILAFIGAELAGGQIFPPSRAHNSEPHSRARVKGRPLTEGKIHSRHDTVRCRLKSVRSNAQGVLSGFSLANPVNSRTA